MPDLYSGVCYGAKAVRAVQRVPVHDGQALLNHRHAEPGCDESQCYKGLGRFHGGVAEKSLCARHEKGAVMRLGFLLLDADPVPRGVVIGRDISRISAPWPDSACELESVQS